MKGMNQYATFTRLKQKGYFFKHSDRGEGRQATKAGRSDSILESRKEQEIINESIRKEDIAEAHQQGLKGVQEPVEGRSRVEETNPIVKAKGKKMKKSTAKHIKHEAKESKAYERKEDKKESKSKKK